MRYLYIYIYIYINVIHIHTYLGALLDYFPSMGYFPQHSSYGKFSEACDVPRRGAQRDDFPPWH